MASVGPQEFIVPARGQGTARDWRAAGKTIGADLAADLVKVNLAMHAAGRHTVESAAALLAEVMAAADAYVAELTARGHDVRMLVKFKTAMLKALRDEHRRLAKPTKQQRARRN